MTPIIDHIGLNVGDFERSKAFYSAALQPLRIKLVKDYPGAAGFGRDAPDFWIAAGTPVTNPMHFAFKAETRAEVDEFYAAAIAAGGKDNGPPGLRTQYHPNYYGAFVFDPDGHNIEAVCHARE